MLNLKLTLMSVVLGQLVQENQHIKFEEMHAMGSVIIDATDGWKADYGRISIS